MYEVFSKNVFLIYAHTHTHMYTHIETHRQILVASQNLKIV